MADKKIQKHTIAEFVVHRQEGYDGICLAVNTGDSNDIPFPDGERLLAMTTATYNALINQANQMRMCTERMKPELLKQLPLGLKFGEGAKEEIYVIEGLIYGNAHGMWFRAVPIDLGIKEVEEGRYDNRGVKEDKSRR